MKKWLIAFVLVLTTGITLGQSGYFAGGGINLAYIPGASARNEFVDVGYGGFGFGVSGHFGVNDLFIQDLDGRVSLGIGFARSVTIFKLAADVLYQIAVDPNSPLTPYAGGGLRLGSVSIRVANVGYSGFIAGIGLVGGATYAFTDELAGFGELNLDIGLGGFTPSLIFGVNYSF